MTKWMDIIRQLESDIYGISLHVCGMKAENIAALLEIRLAEIIHTRIQMAIFKSSILSYWLKEMELRFNLLKILYILFLYRLFSTD